MSNKKVIDVREERIKFLRIALLILARMCDADGDTIIEKALIDMNKNSLAYRKLLKLMKKRGYQRDYDRLKSYIEPENGFHLTILRASDLNIFESVSRKTSGLALKILLKYATYNTIINIFFAVKRHIEALPKFGSGNKILKKALRVFEKARYKFVEFGKLNMGDFAKIENLKDIIFIKGAGPFAFEVHKDGSVVSSTLHTNAKVIKLDSNIFFLNDVQNKIEEYRNED